MGGKRLVSVLTYLVLVSGIFAGSALADPLGLSNDNFESATDISALPYREVVSNLAATDQLGEPRACLGIGKTVWYRLTPANDTIVKVRSDGPTDLVVAVYRGSSLATLGTVECGYATNSSYNGVRFAARAGVTHYIQVGGPAGSVRGKELIIEALPGIAGRLTDEGGNPIEEQCVLLFEADSGWWVDDTFTTRADQFDHPLADAVAGSYVLTGSGRFKVQFYSCWDELYEQEWYDNRADFATADVIEVGAGEAVLGVDAVLRPNSSIIGNVLDQVGDPISNLCIVAYNENGSFAGSAYTDATGNYTLWARAGNLRLLFGCYSSIVVTEYYNDKPDLASADVIALAPYEHLTGIDAVIVRKGSITGRLSSNGAEVEYECITAFDSLGNLVGSSRSFDGFYRLYVPSGTYAVRFGCDISDYQQEFFDDKPDADSADLIAVAAPHETTGIDAELVPLPPPANDDWLDASPLPPGGSSVEGTTRGATDDLGEREVCNYRGRSVWYRHTASSAEDLFLTADAYVTLSVFLADMAVLTPLSQTVACGRAGGQSVTGFRAVAGKTYLIRVGSYSPEDFTLETTLGTASSETTFTAPTPCAVLCPYWNQNRNTEDDNEATCAPTPDAPEGSWDDITVTVPDATEELTPTYMLFYIEPELDFDAWVCRATADGNGKYFVTHAANLILQPCPTAYAFGCFENALAAVSPGDTYVLRVYNWSDRPTTPGGYSFLYGEVPKSPTPIPIAKVSMG